MPRWLCHFRKIILSVRLRNYLNPEERACLKSLGIRMHLLTRKNRATGNSSQNVILIVEFSFREVCNKATGQRFYSAALPEAQRHTSISPSLECTLAVSSKWLPLADNFCNCKVSTTGLFIKIRVILPQSVIGFLVLKSYFPRHTSIECAREFCFLHVHSWVFNHGTLHPLGKQENW